MSTDGTNYDLIVIGAGMAGNAAANKCASAGWRVAIVDELPYGGTCALRGCDPKKILRRGAEIIDSARLMSGKGIDADGLHINWADLMQHKLGFTEPVPANMERGLTGNGVDTMHGTATFTGTNSLDIDGVSYTADHFLIATGARPRPLDFPGTDHLIDSTAFLDLVELPKRILFVGGGFISFEFAHIAARAGTRPTIIDHGPRPLKGFDPDLVDLLVDRSTQAGIDTRTDTSIVSVEADGSSYRVTVERHGDHTTLEADLVVHGAGRISELSRLGLEAAGVEYGPRGVDVAAHLQSITNPAVYAAGDSADTPGMPLTPIAVFEGKIAASNMLKSATTVPDYGGVATAVFTIPELARVGMLESEAVEAGIDLDVRYTDTSGWYSNYRIGETTAA
ncbi:dihydrolipoyl dehydrogenase family protein, partial [Ilumatobacter sp.]